MTVFGIDLGESNLRVAWRDKAGQLTAEAIPAALWLAGPGTIRVGAQAADASMTHPDEVITGVRALLLQHEAAARAGERSQPLAGPNGFTVSAEDAAVQLFAAAASLGTAQGGGPVTDVELGVPELSGRSPALRRAAETAGLAVRDEVAEPVAVALHYGAVTDAADQLVVVFDLGGSTLSVTAMGIAGLSVEILDSATEPLAGDAWDTILASDLLKQLPERVRQDQADALHRALHRVARELRTALDTADQASRLLRYPDQEFELRLDRERFAELSAGLLDRIVAVTQRVLDRAAQRTGERPYTVLLAGGASRMPAVQAVLRTRLDADVRIADPELAVVSGLTLRPGLALLRVRVTVGAAGPSDWAGRDRRPQVRAVPGRPAAGLRPGPDGAAQLEPGLERGGPQPEPGTERETAAAGDPEPPPTAAGPHPGTEHDPEPAGLSPGQATGERLAEPSPGPDGAGPPGRAAPQDGAAQCDAAGTPVSTPPDAPGAEGARPSPAAAQLDEAGPAAGQPSRAGPAAAVPEGRVQADQVLSGQPVQQLRGIRRDGHLLLSWIWPDQSLAARVQWRADSDPAGPRGDARCSRRVYEHDGGFDIAIGSGAATITVEALVPVVELDGPPSVLRVEALAPVVRYDPVVRRGLRHRPVTLTFTSDRDCQLPPVVVVHAVGRLRPDGPHQGTIVHEIPARPLIARQPSQASFELPSLPASSWLVCFPADPDAAPVDLRPVALHRLKVS